MNTELLVGLSASVFGGSLVSFVTYMGNRGKIKAETTKLLAEAERTKAETVALLARPGLSDDPVPLRLSGDDRVSVPPGWFVAGSWPVDYEITLDRTIARSGSCSAWLEARSGARGFATLMQEVRSQSMHGQRIRMSAYVKTEDVEHAALWMRVDGPDHETMSFDNMDDRPMVGTADWCQHSVVLDVSPSSRLVSFGILLSRRGRLWVDDFVFEPVGEDVPTTDMIGGEPKLLEPYNLGFEE